MEYNKIEEFCKGSCGYYIEWDKQIPKRNVDMIDGYEWVNVPCVSCQLQGESERIERVAENCPFKSELEKHLKEQE